MNIKSLDRSSKYGTAEAWIMALRPKTLVAAFSPVLVGCALAWEANAFHLAPSLICLLFGLLMQVGCNLANDYHDFVSGVDTQKRKGFKRAVNEGLIAPEVMRLAAYAVLGLGFFLGMTLIIYGGWWLIAVGVLCVLGALGYSGGPIPVGYLGLGDIMVFIFFGLIAVSFTFFVQAGYLSTNALFAGIGCGLLSANMRLVNDARDRETDSKAGKKTLSVRLGLGYCFIQYSISFFIALLMPLFFLFLGYNFWILLPCLSLGLGWLLVVDFKGTTTSEDYNNLLEKTAMLLLLYAVLFSLGLVLN